jgi:hypothetical protein
LATKRKIILCGVRVADYHFNSSTIFSSRGVRGPSKARTTARVSERHHLFALVGIGPIEARYRPVAGKDRHRSRTPASEQFGK